MDPIVKGAIAKSGVNVEAVSKCFLKSELHVWIDPGDVSAKRGTSGKVQQIYPTSAPTTTNSESYNRNNNNNNSPINLNLNAQPFQPFGDGGDSNDFDVGNNSPLSFVHPLLMNGTSAVEAMKKIRMAMRKSHKKEKTERDQWAQIKAELDFPVDDAGVPEELEKKWNELAMQHFQ